MILFVDDEPYFMDIFREWLARRFVVRMATGADEAMTVLSSEGSAVDAVVLDIMMSPGETFRDFSTGLGRRTGVVLFEEIRRRFPAMPIVVLTAVTSVDVRAYFERQPRCRFLLKPVTPMVLEEALEDVGMLGPGGSVPRRRGARDSPLGPDSDRRRPGEA